MKRLLLAMTSCVVLAGCATTTADEVARREVIDALHALERADRELDAAAVQALMDPTFRAYVDGKRVTYDEVTTQIAASMPAMASFEPDFRDVEVRLLASDVALVTFVFHDDIRMKDGTRIRNWGPTSMIWERRREGWRITYLDADHYDPESSGQDRP